VETDFDKRGGWNKHGGWKIFMKSINVEGGIFCVVWNFSKSAPRAYLLKSNIGRKS
jgi:hypothetical protein